MLKLGPCIAHTHKAWLGLGHTNQLIYLLRRKSRFFTTSRLCARSDSADGSKIRWYNQMYNGVFKRQRFEPNANYVGEDLPEAKLLEGKIKELDEELEKLSTGERGSLVEPLLRDLSEEERAKFYDAVKESDIEENDEPPTDEELEIVDKAMMEAFPEEFTKDMRSSRNKMLLGDIADKLDLLPDEYLLIRRFNNDLGRSADRPSIEAYRKQAWRSYIRCHEKIPSLIKLIPDAAWNALWETQVDKCQDSLGRTDRLIILCSDIQSTGNRLTYNQMMLYLQALIIKGHYTEALDYWQSQQTHVKEQPRCTKFYLLGVRLFAYMGNPRKAQQVALDMIVEGADGAEDIPDILVPVIEAWIRSGGDMGLRHAWAVYLHLRTQLGADIRPEDFDKVAMGFLKAGCTDLALAVFKDLMLTGEATKYESTELYKTSIGIVGKLHSTSINPAELTQVSLTALTILPRRFQNRFFYGSWIKRLIGMGEIDAAAKVVELMYERGVKPSAVHLNGIIGAWLRRGKSEHEKKAERLAWAMIHQRLDLVSRRSGLDLAMNADVQTSSGIPVPVHIKRTVCPATIETFSLLLLHYERRGMLKHVQLLRDFLPRAQISPNSYFMNHLIYAELRHGRVENARKIYMSWSTTVAPDLETFASLWDCEKASLNKLSSTPSSKFPPPRRLFCEMMSWYSKLSSKRRAEVSHTFSKDLYEQIIRCFCLSRDLEGTLVALYALKESFGISPDQDIARMITLQVTSMGTGEAKGGGRRRARLSSNTQFKANLGRVSRLMELLIEQRGQVLQDRGIHVDEAGHVEEHLYLIAELLRTVLLRVTSNTVEMEKGVEKAAWDMGVSGVPMLDPHPGPSTNDSSDA